MIQKGIYYLKLYHNIVILTSWGTSRSFDHEASDPFCLEIEMKRQIRIRERGRNGEREEK